MQLPETLAPWRAWLDWFDPELAVIVGGLLLRLHPLLGAFRLRAHDGRAEPEGVDDLRRRGNYDRLLLSEWALADAAPEEFDRRAAGGEHLFLNPKLVAREVDALTVAVFDCGPSQLGAMRLVHAAMWILLAQRAQAAKARFAWGVAHKPGELHTADSPEQLRRLFASRTFEPDCAAGDAQAAAAALPPRERLEREWVSALDRADPSPGERWSIGLHTPGYGLGHRVDVLRAGAEELSVTIASRQARRETRLRLPAPDWSALLLQGQFDRTQQVSVQARTQGSGMLSLRHPPLISFEARHIAVAWAKESAANVYPVPRPSQDKIKLSVPKTTRWSKSKTLRAATLNGRHFAGLVVLPGHVEFWQMSVLLRAPRQKDDRVESPTAEGRWWPSVLLDGSGQAQRLFVLAPDGRLLAWTRGPGHRGRRSDLAVPQKIGRYPIEFCTVAEHVHALAQSSPGEVFYLRHGDGYLELQAIGFGGDRPIERVAVQGAVNAAFVNARTCGNHWAGGFCVERSVGGHGGERSSVWRVFVRPLRRDQSDAPQASEYEAVLPSDWKVVGLGSEQQGEQYLIALRPDRRTLMRVGAKHRSTLYQASAPIVQVAVAAGTDLIALIDQQGRLVVVHERNPRVLVLEGANHAG
ncbi:hypothetical protein [Lysobacter gummosus]|uniref:Uncharacterized protein n=1 Tax=Lysobacter gummosus TaxID=262324 RepID=A0ABY3X934_9GAMM|nr:hypothetical protein [Lysobacter gummosus]ALN92373.1 hypothetical protein LG3211_3427 [Lysobacter gummosus]UNP27956.1 hypothetical protein MOV92_15800 [Lysobacter gummosus]